MTIDRLSNMLSKIKNAAMISGTFVEVPYTKLCEEVVKVLKDKGFVSGIKVFKDGETGFKGMRIDLINDAMGPKITDIKRISKPGRRQYQQVSDIKSIKGDYILSILSTSRGIMGGFDAKKKKLGGEIICIVK